jgi:hypothetical protein
MDSIRKLFCCDGGNFNIDELKGYDFKEIYTGAPYELIKLSEPELDREEYEISDQDEEVLFDKHEDIAPLRIVIDKQE